MVVNLRPGDVGFLDCVVEECDERFSEGVQGDILRVVEEGFGGGGGEDGGEEGGRGGG